MALLIILSPIVVLLFFLYHRQLPLDSILVEEDLNYPNTPQNRGRSGEQDIEEILLQLPGEFLLYKNLYIPIASEKWTEVDLVVIHEKGIFVVESKNYTGIITGEAQDNQWSKTLSNSFNQRFYNPIKQNATHLRALEQYLGDLPMYSVIVFGKEAELHVEPMPASDVYVCKVTQLYFLWDLLATLDYVVDIYDVQSQIEQLEKANWSIQQQHIENLMKKLENKAIS